MNENNLQKCKILKNHIKYVIANKGMTLKDFVQILHDKYGRCANASSFSTRLDRGSLTILEFLETLECLGYDINIEDIHKRLT